MKIDMTKVFEALEKAPVLKGLKSFTFRPKKGELRTYTRTPMGWARDWKDEIETDELVVKIVYVTAKRDGCVVKEQREGE